MDRQNFIFLYLDWKALDPQDQKFTFEVIILIAQELLKN